MQPNTNPEIGLQIISPANDTFILAPCRSSFALIRAIKQKWKFGDDGDREKE